MPPPDPKRHEQKKLLFAQAMQQPPAERAAWVRANVRDQALAKSVLELLDAVPNESAVDRVCAAAAEALHDSGAARPEQIGPYKILDVLGEGGMGTVYRAEQRQPFRRSVALKVVQAGLATKEVLARFGLERRALAAMSHRSIAKVLDAGATERGEPYFVMELIEGLPITTYCDKHRLGLTDRLRLFQQVCEGVHHAHLKGIVHRDLKPGNVMVVREGNEVLPKILDFGLAKATNRDFLDETLFTEKDRVMGTPEYMAPEQAAGDGEGIDARADIYALGVMLYELLCGELPFPTEMLRKAGAFEAMRMIREQEPAKPSTRLTSRQDRQTLADRRRTTLAGLRRELAGDLDWIVLKAMSKEPERRYDAATALAADIGRYLDHMPVLAGPPSVGYRLKKLLKRYRAQVAAAVGIFAAVVAGLVVALVQRNEAQRQREVAEVAKMEADRHRQAAEREERRATRLFEDYSRLQDAVMLRQFEQRAQQDLWPEGSRRRQAMEQWSEQVEQWLDELPDHAATLAELRRRGTQVGDTWTFPDRREQFLHDALTELTDGLARFRGTGGTLERVKDSLDWSRRVRKETIDDQNDAWVKAAAEVRAHPDFHGMILAPQEGLVPLGRDPASGLQEFLFARSGTAPTRHAETGQFIVEEATGIVLVLLPGGKARIGTDPGEGVPRIETPVHDVQLSPFLIGKYELTQAQWLRLTGANPSKYHPPAKPQRGAPTFTNPVENVSWREAVTALHRSGLELPTEAQWEYACRAGTATRWWFGDTREELQHANKGLLNAADGFVSRRDSNDFVPEAEFWPDFDDGFVFHAPVGSFKPNTFGLFDMHGNIAELTRGAAVPYPSGSHAPGDGVLIGPEDNFAIQRGGSFWKRVEDARSATRIRIGKDAKFDNVGIRVARRLD